MDLRPKQEMKAAGFTLMEVTIALLVLASALVVLLGLQSSSVQRAVRDRSQQEAMLAARSILAAIEIGAEDLETQDTTDSAAALFEKLTGGARQDEEDRLSEKYQANLRVEELEIPVPNTDPKFAENPIRLKQVILTVFWGESPNDQLRVVFLVPSDYKE